MKLYARYVGWLYFKNFVVLFVALTLFYVGVDALTNLKDMPMGANLKLLYFGFTALGAVNYVLPLSIIFALIVSKFSMIRSNELVSFYALGVSKNSLVKPPFFIALLITAIYIALNFTPFAYARDMGRNVLKASQLSRTSSDIFVKFEGKFVYIKELDPFGGKARNVRIFDVNSSGLNEAIFAADAEFIGGEWVLGDAEVTKLPEILRLGGKGLSSQNFSELKTLANFKPKTIENAAVGDSAVSISDALDFIFAFKNETAALNSAKTTLYNLAVAPFFAPLTLFIIYYFLPVTGRFMSLALASFVFTVVTLCAWGVLFVLTRFAQNGVLSPETAVLLPIFLLFCYANYLRFCAR